MYLDISYTVQAHNYLNPNFIASFVSCLCYTSVLTPIDVLTFPSLGLCTYLPILQAILLSHTKNWSTLYLLRVLVRFSNRWRQLK